MRNNPKNAASWKETALRKTIAKLMKAVNILSEAFVQQRSENERLRQENELLKIDELTGFKRRNPNTEGEIIHHLELAKRHRLKVAFLFVDLDDFSEINDTLGHDVGDAALKAISNEIKRHIREEEFVCRWGGDEILILFSFKSENEDPCETAMMVANRIMKGISQIPFSMPLSASIGCIMLEENEGFPEALKRADVEMYKMKEAKKGMPK